MNRVSGFSLLEWLIASALSLLIADGLMMAYLGIKTNYSREQTIIDLQDSARFAVTYLHQRIRQAGWAGCADSANPVHQAQAIQGYDSSTALPSVLQNQMLPGTDAVVINSCVDDQKLSQDTQLKSIAYYIGDTGRVNLQGQPIWGLFQKPVDGDRDELVAGVEQMRILYGAAHSENKLTYYTAAAVPDWQQVRGLQIDLLFNSIDAVLRQPQPYYFNGQTIIADDLLWHQSWNTYIDLRERIE